MPLTECLKDTVARFLPLWHETIAPAIQARRAGVNRGARQQLARAGEVSGQRVRRTKSSRLNIPTGMPLVYELDDDLKPLNRYYLGDRKR